MGTKKKTVTRIYAVLNTDWTYRSYGGRETIPMGERFDTGRKGNGKYIDLQGNLVLPHWFGYGQAEVIPADKIDLYEETDTTTVVVKTTARRMKVEGGKYVPVKTAKKKV